MIWRWLAREASADTDGSSLFLSVDRQLANRRRVERCAGLQLPVVGQPIPARVGDEIESIPHYHSMSRRAETGRVALQHLEPLDPREGGIEAHANNPCWRSPVLHRDHRPAGEVQPVDSTQREL